MPSNLIRVSLAFARAADHQLEETAGEVILGLTGNAEFPTPPIAILNIEEDLSAFTAAIAAQDQGGTAATALKEQRRAALVDTLRKFANYVQGVVENVGDNPEHRMAVLLSSGFEGVTTERTRSPLVTPATPQVKNGNDGELILKAPPVKNAKAYEVRYHTGDNVWKMGGLFTGARDMHVIGLTPGTTYTLEVRAIGGSTGFSGWTDAVQRMAT